MTAPCAGHGSSWIHVLTPRGGTAQPTRLTTPPTQTPEDTCSAPTPPSPFHARTHARARTHIHVCTHKPAPSLPRATKLFWADSATQWSTKELPALLPLGPQPAS